jgi:hypothetical protein
LEVLRSGLEKWIASRTSGASVEKGRQPEPRAGKGQDRARRRNRKSKSSKKRTVLPAELKPELGRLKRTLMPLVACGRHWCSRMRSPFKLDVSREHGHDQLAGKGCCTSPGFGQRLTPGCSRMFSIVSRRSRVERAKRRHRLEAGLVRNPSVIDRGCRPEFSPKVTSSVPKFLFLFRCSPTPIFGGRTAMILLTFETAGRQG